MDVYYMDISYIIYVGIILALCFTLSTALEMERNVVKYFLMSMIIFGVQYLAFSVVFLWLDLYRVKTIILLILRLDVILTIVARKRIAVRKVWEKTEKKDFFIIAILIVLLPLIWTKSEDMRPSGDMGMYFEKTAVLVSEDTTIVRELEEEKEISDSVDEGLEVIQEQLLGIYKREGESTEKTQYEYHALPTWVSFMALFAKMFGLFNSAQALTYIYIWAVLACYFTCQNISKTFLGKYASIFVFALCPVVMYVAKTTLTELTFVALLFSTTFLLSEKSDRVKLLGGICLALLGFVHVSTSMYLPGIYVALLYLSIVTSKKEVAYANIISCVMYIVSLFYCRTVSGLYTEAQLAQVSFLGKDTEQIIFSLSIIFILAILVQIVFLYLCNRECRKKVVEIIQKIVPVGLIIMELLIVIGAIYEGYLLGFTDKCAPGGGTWHLRSTYVNQGFASLSYLNIVNIMRASSFVIIPILFIYCVGRKNKQNSVQNALFFVLYYAMLIYTYVLIDTPTNYYASRYFVLMIIPMMALVVATMITKVNVFTCLLVAWCLVYTIRYDYNFMFRGSFLGQHEMWNDVQEVIPVDSAVMVRSKDSSTNQILVNNLRVINSNRVYNFENINEVRDYWGGPVYVISKENLENMGELLLFGQYEIMGNLGGEGAAYMTEEMATYTETLYVYLVR